MSTILTALLAAATLVAPPETFDLPAPTGPHDLGTRQVHLVDPARDRELMITTWYPARAGGEPFAPYLSPASAAAFDQGHAAMGLRPGQVDWGSTTTHARVDARPVGRWPVVLYSPGYGSLRTLATTAAEDLASRGYVVVALDHTHEAPFVEFPGGRLEVRQPPGDDPLRTALATRVADARFVLDRLPSVLGSSADLSRIGMFGHSYGGDTTAELMVTDRRVDAGANLDGWLAYDIDGTQPTRAATEGVDRPFLLMGSAGNSRDGQVRTHRTAPAWGAFWEHSTGFQRDLVMAQAMHYSYTDVQSFLPQLDADPAVRALRIGTVDPARSTASQRAYLAAFFDRALKHRPQPLLRHESPDHPDVAFVR
ncbi:alpha/beta hydrolase family protein [Umezawaea endophytica]|uniref:Platelet-activating factor acetylhydrolase n=1 Tax=Umezawaea endophytica TaxID=1654476 RepID=A0A9X2VYH9_9PSEU|nr:hypothetical protein [Umezawaea endophytica]MCS7484359.1 hypothetical protein [Umezawaea endophytica]